MGKEKKFEEDQRKTNPGLHLIYTKWACRHLTILDRMIQELNDCANINMDDPCLALANARAHLVNTNAAYADADEILKLIESGRTGKEVEQDETEETVSPSGSLFVP